MHASDSSAGRWRPIAILVAIILVAVIALSFAPVRQAAADFLRIFRVQQVAVVEIPAEGWQEQQAVLYQMMENLERGAFGEPTFLRELGEPVAVKNTEEASALAGFRVDEPTYLPVKLARAEFVVVQGPAVRYSLDRETAQSALEMLGITDISLPAAEQIDIEADIPAMVAQGFWGEGSMALSLLQVWNASATIQPEMDPTLLGEALLRALGMPADQAERMARSIDWTSTLVLPVIADPASSYREVAVDGRPAIALLSVDPEGAGPPTQALVWQRDDVVYMLAGTFPVEELIRVAESLG